MKTQQRNFIVEIKSNGRRTAVRQGSIWGNTDLKAMARQAASVAPQLYDGAPEVESIVEASGPDFLNPAPIAQAEVAPVLDLEDQPRTPSEALMDEVTSVAASIISSPEVSLVAPNALVKAKRPRKLGLDRRARNVAELVIAAPDNVTGEAPIDELASLEAENRQLKAAFTVYLRQQNQALRSMLERFDAS